MKYSKERPTEVGWYWMRQGFGKIRKASVVYVRRYVETLAIDNWPLPKNAEWAGPLEEPEDA